MSCLIRFVKEAQIHRAANSVSCVNTHVCILICLYFSSRGQAQRAGVIGSSLSSQTDWTFHHRGISLQYSKPQYTSWAFNKVLTNTSTRLFNHPFDCMTEREPSPSYSQRGNDSIRKHREKETTTTKQFCFDPQWTIRYRTFGYSTGSAEDYRSCHWRWSM